MAIEVVLPKVDMDMENGTIAAWHVADGDFVRQGDILFEMETNKSVMEVESPGTGRIRGLAPVTGEPVDVGTAVAWIEVAEPHADAAPSQAPALRDTEPAAAAPAGAASPDAAPAPAATTREAATTASASTSASVAASGAAKAPAAPHAATQPGGERRATPFARHTARSHDVDLAAVSGSGPRGRIGAADVLAHVEARTTAESGPAAAQPDASMVPAGETGRLQPFSPTRRIVAQRLAESMRTAPHFYLTAQVEMTALLAWRVQVAPEVARDAGTKPTMTVLLAWLAARVLRAHPVVNASAEADAIRFHEHVDIGIAMDRDGDLVVPVLRDVASRSLAEVTREYRRLHDGVRARTLPPADLRGGTFTLSNLGMYGVDAFTAIINPPQVAILAVGRTVDTPVGRDGQVVLRPMVTLSLSSDHRIVDGMVAARFMADLRRAIEAPGLAA
jgi:pyruvate dehydrogenase E2 component (dihydrolipoamide acetyltransferase)